MNGYTFAEGERGDAGGTEAVLDMADGADTADDSATTLGRGMNWKSKGFTVSAYVLDGTGTEEDADSSDANSASDSDSASASASASGSRISNGRGSGSDSDTVGSRRRLRPKTGGVPGVTSLSLREAQAQEAQEARDTAAALVGDGGATAAATRALTQLDAALAHTSLLVDVAATNKTLAAAGLPVVRLAPQNPVDALHALLSSVRDAAAKVAETKAALEQTRQEKKAVVKQVRRAQVDAAKLRKDHEGRDRESRDLQRRLAAAESALLESRKRVKLLESEIIIVRKDFNLEKLAVESSSPAKDIKTLSNVRRVKSMPFSPASVKIPPSKLIIDTLASPSENNTTTTTTTTPTADLTPTVIDEPTANIQPVLTREEKDELDRQLEAVEIARRAADIARRHAVSFSYDSSSLQTATFAAGRATVLAEAAVLSSIISPPAKSTPAMASPTLSASTVTCSTPTTQIAFNSLSLPGTPSSLVSVTPTPKGVGKRQAASMEANMISAFSIASTVPASEQEQEQQQTNKTEYVGKGSGTHGKSKGYDDAEDADQHHRQISFNFGTRRLRRLASRPIISKDSFSEDDEFFGSKF